MSVDAVVGVVEDGEHGDGDNGTGYVEAEEGLRARDAPDKIGTGLEGRGNGDNRFGEGFQVSSTAVQRAVQIVSGV